MGKSGKKMFYGQYEHSIDDKNRLMIPRKMRDEAGIKLFILKGYEGSLAVYKASDFEELVAKLQELSYTQKDTRDVVRAILGSASEVEVDKQGRIQIPTYLMNKFQIDKAVTIIGAGNHFEIWNTASYNEYDKNLDASFESVSENLFKNK